MFTVGDFGIAVNWNFFTSAWLWPLFVIGLVLAIVFCGKFAIGGEHYYTKFSSGSSANLILLDASVRWNISKKVDISLTAANLLNQREYRYASYGLLSETEYMYRLRGRSVMASIQVRL